MSNNNLQILYSLYKFRFLTSKQIQKLLNHKYHNRINVWLNKLVNNYYLRKYFDKKSVTKPAIYSLGIKGKKYLIENGENINKKVLNRVWRENKLSNRFRNHCLYIADYYLKLKKDCKNKGSKLHFYTQADLYGMESLLEPHPDAYFAIEDKNKKIKRYFLDIFNEMTPRYALRRRVKQYVDYFEEETWREETGKSFPKIIFICLDENSKNYLERYIRSILEDDVKLEFIFVG